MKHKAVEYDPIEVKIVRHHVMKSHQTEVWYSFHLGDSNYPRNKPSIANSMDMLGH